MTRPTDWQPLADRDPIPGDPTHVDRLIEDLGDLIGDINMSVRVMEAIKPNDEWDSDAAVVFTEMKDDIPPVLELVATRFTAISEALYQWRVALDKAQEASVEALGKARSAQDELEAARTELDELDSGSGEVIPGLPSGTETGRTMAEGRLESARATLQEARDELAAAEDARNAAASRCVEAINGSINDGLRNDHIYFDFLHGVSDWAGWASAILGTAALVALVPPFTPAAPFLAVGALLTGGVALGADVQLWAAGEAKPDNTVWGIIGVLSAGVGRTADEIIKGIGRAKAASRAATDAELWRTRDMLNALNLGTVSGRTKLLLHYQDEIWLYEQLQDDALHYHNALRMYLAVHKSDRTAAERLLMFVRAARPDDPATAARLAMIRRTAEMIGHGSTVRDVADRVKKEAEARN